MTMISIPREFTETIEYYIANYSEPPTPDGDAGERVLPNPELYFIFAEHMCRYFIAGNLAKGRDAIDIATGDGYGAHYLSNFANKVIGFDIDQCVIQKAKNKYKSNNLAFYSGDLDSIVKREGPFDVATAFEVIEHVSDPDNFLDSCMRALNWNGELIISTPNYQWSSNFHNPHHLKEYMPGEFKKLLRKYFKDVRMYGQRPKIKLITPKNKNFRYRLLTLAVKLDIFEIRKLLRKGIRDQILSKSGAAGTGITFAQKINADQFEFVKTITKKTPTLFAICTRKK